MTRVRRHADVREVVAWIGPGLPMYDRLPIDTWVTGRIALLGDAAHPMSAGPSAGPGGTGPASGR
jgi:2-polyprenyl-6-methoxyphenol hydroxylase-like FAD-dependent oxidoreductase